MMKIWAKFLNKGLLKKWRKGPFGEPQIMDRGRELATQVWPGPGKI